MISIVPGNLYVDCQHNIRYCISSDYENGEIRGVSLYGDNEIVCCSPFYCKPKLLSQEEAPFAIALCKNLFPMYTSYFTYDELTMLLNKYGYEEAARHFRGTKGFENFIDECIHIIDEKMCHRCGFHRVCDFSIGLDYLYKLIAVKEKSIYLRKYFTKD